MMHSVGHCRRRSASDGGPSSCSCNLRFAAANHAPAAAYSSSFLLCNSHNPPPQNPTCCAECYAFGLKYGFGLALLAKTIAMRLRKKPRLSRKTPQ